MTGSRSTGAAFLAAATTASPMHAVTMATEVPRRTSKRSMRTPTANDAKPRSGPRCKAAATPASTAAATRRVKGRAAIISAERSTYFLRRVCASAIGIDEDLNTHEEEVLMRRKYLWGGSNYEEEVLMRKKYLWGGSTYEEEVLMRRKYLWGGGEGIVYAKV